VPTNKFFGYYIPIQGDIAIDSSTANQERQHHEHPFVSGFDTFSGDFRRRGFDSAGIGSGGDNELRDRSGDSPRRAGCDRYTGSWSGPVERFLLPRLYHIGDEDQGKPVVRSTVSDIHRGLRLALIRDSEHLFLVRADSGDQSSHLELSTDYNVHAKPSADYSRPVGGAGDRALHRCGSEAGESLK